MVVSDLVRQKTQLLRIFFELFAQLMVALSVKSKTKNAHPSFPESKETFSDAFFCPTSSSQLKRYSVYNDIKQRKAANTQIGVARTSKSLAFLLEK